MLSRTINCDNYRLGSFKGLVRVKFNINLETMDSGGKDRIELPPISYSTLVTALNGLKKYMLMSEKSHIHLQDNSIIDFIVNIVYSIYI